MMVLFSLDVSTQVTKSSMCLLRKDERLGNEPQGSAYRVTRYAGSVIVSGPTRTWPCSINLTACARVSDVSGRTGRCTHRADGLGHLGHAHDDGKTTATKGGDGELVVDVAELGGRVEHAHVVEFGQKLGLHLGAERILGRKTGQTVGILSEGAAQLVVSEQDMRHVGDKTWKTDLW